MAATDFKLYQLAASLCVQMAHSFAPQNDVQRIGKCMTKTQAHFVECRNESEWWGTNEHTSRRLQHIGNIDENNIIHFLPFAIIRWHTDQFKCVRILIGSMRYAMQILSAYRRKTGA